MEDLIRDQRNHHFCIKNSKIEEILECFKALEVERLKFDENFNWAEIYKEENGILLIETSFDWSYLVFNVFEFDFIKKIMKSLSEKLKTEINYFFIDTWGYSSRWIHAKNGVIIRSFYEARYKVIEESGALLIEDQIRNKFKNEKKEDIWEKVYWEMVEVLNPPIISLNKEATYKGIRIKANKGWL